LGIEGETEEERNWVKINLLTTMSMKNSRRELSIDMVVLKDIFNNNQITLFPCFTFIPKTVVSVYCVDGSDFV